ncbi:L,D-transpeptidase family protein [Sphingomonas montana]|uniref:L,D-transpeptidase family protein n=1 Tax=Sphingomonas montana TaxID=1843236 RepID=UPI001F0A8200|nr:L,D-transpeptidase family protein [Sphingomonas montana]
MAVVSSLAIPVVIHKRQVLAEPSVEDITRSLSSPAIGGRVFLTAPQMAETRDPTKWPVVMRSLLRIDRPLGYGQWIWNDRGVGPGRTTVRVDLGTQLISVFRGGHEIGTSVILYGAATHETPVGQFPILSKAADYHSRTYDAPMPYTLRLTADGVAIHGSNVASGRATHGCIGLPLEFARRLFQQAKRGDMVLILR